jgi:hypothetical protein
MNKRLFIPSLLILLTLGSILYTYDLKDAQALSPGNENTLVLYNAASGVVPSETLMDFTDFPPGAASLSYSDGATALDTSLSGNDTFAGWVSGQALTPGFPSLDRGTGFQVNFTLQVENESHTNNNRAGFSVILLDQDAKGIELAFWENEIWAQTDDRTGGLFTHGEGVTYPTTGLTEYQVSIVGDTYTLKANSEQLLTGPVRDYSKFDGFPDPYETPNFLFWGDDSTTAAAGVKLRFASVSGSEPVSPTATTTNIPQPTATTAPLSSATLLPVPTPTPAGNVFKICSSGWVFLGVAVGSVLFSNRIRRRNRKRS